MITDYAAEALTAFQERAPAIIHAQGDIRDGNVAAPLKPHPRDCSHLVF